MDKSIYQPATYRISVGTDYNPHQVESGLSKSKLRDRVDQWFKDERALTLLIEKETDVAMVAVAHD